MRRFPRGAAGVLAILAVVSVVVSCYREHSAAFVQADTRFRAHDAVPFPGTSDQTELLANVQYSVWKSRLYGSGLEAVFEPDAVRLAWVVPVESPELGDYFLI